MYYLTHLALPAVVALLMVVFGPQYEWSWNNFDALTDALLRNYLILAAPHWIWAAVSAYFDAEKSTTVGGFVGLDVLLLVVWIFVLRSNVPEAANAWFLYFLGAPVIVAIGSIVGRRIALLKPVKAD